MARVLVVAECHVLPEITGALVAQVFTIETDLVVTLSHCGLVFGHDPVISKERGDHVDKVGPREEDLSKLDG